MNKLVKKYYKINAYLHYKYSIKIKLKKYRRLKKIAYDPEFSLKDLLNKIILPDNKILFLHVGLKQIKATTNRSYFEITKLIISYLIENLTPSAIVVPTFTWSFIKTGLYSINYSKAETGMFAELFRNFADYRTPNTLQSFSIISKNLELYKNLNHNDTFASNGIYEYFRQNETYIIDIATDTLRASPLHHIERVCNLCYLNKPYNEFKGYIFDENNIPSKITQKHGGTFIYDSNYTFNKEKIHNFLLKNGIMKDFYSGALKVSIINNNLMHKKLETKLMVKPYYAITF